MKKFGRKYQAGPSGSCILMHVLLFDLIKIEKSISNRMDVALGILWHIFVLFLKFCCHTQTKYSLILKKQTLWRPSGVCSERFDQGLSQRISIYSAHQTFTCIFAWWLEWYVNL